MGGSGRGVLVGANDARDARAGRRVLRHVGGERRMRRPRGHVVHVGHLHVHLDTATQGQLSSHQILNRNKKILLLSRLINQLHL